MSLVLLLSFVGGFNLVKFNPFFYKWNALHLQKSGNGAIDTLLCWRCVYFLR